MKLLLLNGPNLNLLGTREPQTYGTTTLADIEAGLALDAAALGVELACFQSNHEGALIDRIHAARSEGVAFILINPGAKPSATTPTCRAWPRRCSAASARRVTAWRCAGR